jgi:predicted nucleic acid-binding protein
MSELRFVDTNILVCARDIDQALKQQIALQCLRECWENRTGRISAQVLCEYYFALTRKLKPGSSADEAWDDVQALKVWAPQPTDMELIQLAREIERRYLTSWWDAMIVAAAQLQGCGVLLSEDFQDGVVFGQVTVRNPFLARPADASIPDQQAFTAKPRHRGRGRPRRAG